MRARIAVAVLTLSACSVFRGGPSGVRSNEDVVLAFPVPADTALRVAITQLQLHNYRVNPAGPGLVVTSPRPVPDYLIEVSNDAKASRPRQQWILRVQVDKQRFVSGSRVMVNGYILPPTGVITAGNRMSQHAIPVTAENVRLFREVQVVGEWIAEAVKRHPSGG
ncbi:MAG: hypothetical protein NVS1B4_03310 [Gemmatimonadaceae bacterium]